MSGEAPEDGVVAIEEVIRRRRVARLYGAGAVDDHTLAALAEAAYWAPSGGNRKPVRVVAVRLDEQVRRVIAVSPGIIGTPPALLVLCIDWSRAPHLQVDDPRTTHSSHVDVGAAMQNVLVMAEAKGLAACPVMSFHRASVRAILGAPKDWTPLVIVAVGVRRPEARSPGARVGSRRDWILWDRYGNADG